jgi:hypothetical protein
MDSIAQARTFFASNGRDIDKARFAYHFEGAAQVDLLAVLARYQNPDGGFHGLEVDIKAPESNPFASELALLICAQAGAPREHALLQRAAQFLETTQDEDGGWRFSPGVYEHDLAPWFQGWQWPNLNPACGLAGLLKELGLGSPGLHARVEGLFERFATVKDVATGEFYDVRPYAGYFLPEWAHPQREFYLSGVLWWLIRQQVEGKIQDAPHFFEYVRSPQTFIGARLPASLLAEQLDRLAAEQAEDGGWPTPYDEGWRGWVTLQSLLVLRQFGRI